MTIEPEPQARADVVGVVLEPMPPSTQASASGHGFQLDYDPAASDEPFLVLRGEEPPPPGVQAVAGYWALITMAGEPAAFVSPDVVASLDADVSVAACVFAGLRQAYAAELGRPRDFYRGRLGRPRTVTGRVIVLDHAAAERFAGRALLTEFDDAQCDYGRILPVGETCEDCMCPRRLP
jgi:hypothetical protein